MEWRLIDSGQGSGPWNLALDEALFASVRAGESPPTLRFYAWSAPTLSLGYAQDREADVALDACRARGIEVVRRITGGRAVLHEREVTYSVSSPESALFGTNLESACSRIAAGLVAGLRRLGLEAALPAPGRGRTGRRPRHPACFEHSARHEVEVGGRKIVGSAQRRSGGAFLQHGSILLEDHAAALAVLVRAHRPCDSSGRAAGIGDFLRPCPSYAAVVDSMAAGFAGAWGVRLHHGAPTEAEERLAAGLEESKYRSDAWNGPTPSPAPTVGPH